MVNHGRRRDTMEIRMSKVLDYELVLGNNEVSIVATNTDEYKSVAGWNGTNTHSTGLNRVDRTLGNISHDHRERSTGNRLYVIQVSLTSNSANSLNADLGNETIPIMDDADKQSPAFVGRRLICTVSSSTWTGNPSHRFRDH